MLYPIGSDSLHVQICDPSGIGDARRGVVRLSDSLGVPTRIRDRLAIVATEMATNANDHGGGGHLFASGLAGPDGPVGLELIVVDRGPGMVDIERCMQDGFSTRGSSGTGMGALSRLSTDLWIDSVPGRGTVMACRVVASADSRDLQISGLCGRHPGEKICGDRWAVADRDRYLYLLLADGLGHGPDAAVASAAAAEGLHQVGSEDAVDLMRKLHDRLRATRGAAILLVRVDRRERRLSYAGAGNVWGMLMSPELGVQNMVALGGIVGHGTIHPRHQELAIAPHSLLVLCTDGFHHKLDPRDDPSIMRQPASITAGIMFRDLGRGTDDAGTLVARFQQLREAPP